MVSFSKTSYEVTYKQNFHKRAYPVEDRVGPLEEPALHSLFLVLRGKTLTVPASRPR